MRSHSAVARLQQVTTLTVLIVAAVWLLYQWPSSPLLALVGFVAMTMGHSLILAIEFVALRIVGRDDPAPRPSWPELARAWLRETIMATRVFCWRQPFRWRAIPDTLEPTRAQPARRGAVFVHGFVCNRGFWTPWLKRMREMGHPFVAVNLEPMFGSMDEYVSIIEQAVQSITKASGLPPVLICHSMGGLVARAWLREMAARDRIHHIITIASPHRGTWLAQFSHLTNGRQMRQDSAWLEQLQQHSDDPVLAAKFTCWYSNCDNIVFPVSNATLVGAENRLVRGAAHVDLGFDTLVMDQSLAMVSC